MNSSAIVQKLSNYCSVLRDDGRREKGDANPFYASDNYDELINRDKASLDIFWLRGESLEEPDNLPAPDVLAQEIVEDLEAALEQFREIAVDLVGKTRRNEHHSQGAGTHRVCKGVI